MCYLKLNMVFKWYEKISLDIVYNVFYLWDLIFKNYLVFLNLRIKREKKFLLYVVIGWEGLEKGI